MEKFNFNPKGGATVKVGGVNQDAPPRIGGPTGPNNFPPPPPPPPSALQIVSVLHNVGDPTKVIVEVDQLICWTGDVPQWIHQETGEPAFVFLQGSGVGPAKTFVVQWLENINAGDHIVIPADDLVIQSRAGGLIAAQTVVVG